MRRILFFITIFGFASPAIAESLTIGDAVQRALATSPKVKIAEADRAGQTERKRSAWADVGPRVKAEYTHVKFDDAQTANFGGAPITLRPEESKTGKVMVVQPITGAFALIDRARMESSQEDVKDWSLSVARSETGFQTAEAWLKAYQTKRQVEIADASVQAAESQQRDAAALERAGRMNRGDVLKLELAVSEAKARAAQMRALADVMYASLKEAVGIEQDTPLELAGDLPKVAEDDPTEADAYKRAMERRLEPKVAEGGVTAAGFGKKLAYSNFSPGVNVFMQWERSFGEPAGFGARDTRDAEISEMWTKSVGVQATWDIWNNGSHVFQVREAAQNVHKAEQAARGVDMQVRLDVKTALANLKAAREMLALAKVAVSQAEEAYRIEKVRFRTGARSATDLILAETSNASAQGRLVTAQTDLITWNMRLKKALGDEQPLVN